MITVSYWCIAGNVIRTAPLFALFVAQDEEELTESVPVGPVFRACACTGLRRKDVCFRFRFAECACGSLPYRPVWSLSTSLFPHRDSPSPAQILATVSCFDKHTEVDKKATLKKCSFPPPFAPSLCQRWQSKTERTEMAF